MFREALDYPTRPPRGGRAVLVGGASLVLVGVIGAVAGLDTEFAPVALLAVAPWLLVRGYYVRVVRTTIGHGYPTPPSFGSVGALLRDGVAAVTIAVGYLLPGAAVLAPLVYLRARGDDVVAVLLGEGVDPAVAGGVNAGAGVVALFAVFSLIGAWYVLPVAVATYAYTGRLGAAFDVRSVVSGAATEDYVVAWFVSVLLQVLLLPVAYLLKAILVGFFLQFLVAVGVRYCYGQGVGAALGLGPLEEPTGAVRSTAAIGEAEATSTAPGTAGVEASDDLGDVRSAVRPIEETDAPELESSDRGGAADSRPAADDSADSRPAVDDSFESPER